MTEYMGRRHRDIGWYARHAVAVNALLLTLLGMKVGSELGYREAEDAAPYHSPSTYSDSVEANVGGVVGGVVGYLIGGTSGELIRRMAEKRNQKKKKKR